jgi:hypothetical protein
MATPCRRLLLATILLSTILMPTSLASATSAETCVPASQTVAPHRLAALSRGFNADGWINGEKSAPPTRELLQQLRKAGMSHVRLPVPAERVMLRFASKAERDETLRALDKALKQLISLGYSISVDLHPGDRFNRLHKDDADASLRELEDAWGTLARVIQSFPADRVFAELLNEPDIEAGRWQKQVETLAAFVRQLLPATTLIVGPVDWQRADSLPRFRPLPDPNVVYAIHFYDPMVFTHQGHWDVQDPLHDITDLRYPISGRSRGSGAPPGFAGQRRDEGAPHARHGDCRRQGQAGCQPLARARGRVAAAIFAADHHQRIWRVESRGAPGQPRTLARGRDRICAGALLGLGALGAGAGIRPARKRDRQARSRRHARAVRRREAGPPLKPVRHR